MSKRMTRVLSLILTLIMFVSVSTPAFAWGGGDLGSGWDREIGEDEIRDFDEPVVEEEETLDYFHALDEDSLLEVTVEAPMGALPTLAELRAEPVEIEDVREAVETVVDGKANILVAMDISFWMNGVEIEPEEPVNVKISAPELADKSNLTLVHIPDAAEPETIDLIDEGDLGFALGTTEIAFKANSFSVYVIVDGEPEPPETVTYRRTYKFTTDGTTPFEFYNKAGKKVTEQIVKTGDTLEAVTLPYAASHTFQNWVVSASDDKFVKVDDTVDLPLEITDAINENEKDTTVTLKPAYGNVYYVTFHAADLPADPDIIQTKKILGENEKVVIGDVQAPAPDESHIFFGWTADSQGKTGETAVYDENNQLVRTTEYPTAITADLDLYPYFVEAYWLRFVSGETGSRASYVPAQFARADQTLTDLPVPTRIGYTFDGWYTGSQNEETGAITYNEQVTNGTGKVINPASGLQLTGETVLYGHWTAKNDSSYKVVIWRQKVTDDKNAADAAKTYDYAESDVRTGTTDAAAEPSSADTTKSGGDYTGFHYSRYAATNNGKISADGSTIVNVYYDRDLMAMNFYYKSGDAPSDAEDAYTYTATTSNDGTQYGVKPDGTYVQLTRGEDHPTTRVYYTFYGYEYTGTFYTRSGNRYVASQYSGSNLPPEGDTTTYYADFYGYYYQLTRQTETVHNYGWTYTEDGQTVNYTGTRYTRATMSGYPKMVTWTGLYGQSFEKNGYTWPAEYKWNEQSDGNGTGQTFLTDFVDTRNPYNLYDQGESGTAILYHYKQGLDGKYSQDEGARYTARRSLVNGTNTFYFTNKFEGFKVASYNTGNNGFDEDGGDTPAVHNQTTTTSTQTLHIYHTRNKWTITYQATESEQSTQFVTVKTSDEIYYEAPLGTKGEDGKVTSDYDLTQAQAGLPDRPGYTFSGWYADETCTTKFDFSGTMPNANVTVYAGWEPVWYQILVDPDGGIITSDIGATYMWKQHGTDEKLGRYEIVRPYIEDPNGTFGYVYVDGRDDPDGNIKVRTATYETWTEGKKYRLIDPAVDPTYTLVGWYDVDFETGETTSTPHDFDAEITGPVWIRAVWNLGGDYGLVYNATAQVTVKEGQDPVTVSGTFTQADPDARYADGAEFVVDVPPTNVTNGFVFDGWEIVEPNVGETQGEVLDDNGGNYYQPGETITLDAAAWSRNKTVYLRAHYTPVEGSDQPIGVTYLQFKPNFPADAKVTNGEETDVKYYPLNSAIDLANDEFVPTDYTAGGYKLIGWSQNKDAEPVVHAEGAGLGEIVFGLKDTIGVDAITPTEKATFVKEDGEEIEVDCNVLYAIWAPVYFYVYHSSDNTVEKIQMPVNEDGTFDLTSKVASGFLYGGYYSDYGKKGDYDIANPAEYTSAVSNSTAYVGGIGPWKAANAIKTAKGTEMIPEADKTYFLKEVPSVFLKSILYVIYDAKNVEKKNLIVHNYLIADVDDNNYNEIGLIASNITTGDRIKLATSYSIVDTFNGKTDKINAATFGATKGYVAVWKPDLATKDFDFVPFFVTPDGVTVEGSNVRSISWGDGTYQEWKAPGVTFSDAANDKIGEHGNVSTRN